MPNPHSLPLRRLLSYALLLVPLLGLSAARADDSNSAGNTTNDDYTASGRFAVRSSDAPDRPPQSASGRFNWQHAAGGDTLLLADPLGNGIAEIRRDPAGARLTASDRRQYTAADADSLARQVLGYPLPVSGLADWLQARPHDAGAAGRREFDGSGRLKRLVENGWWITYDYRDERAPRPYRLTAAWGNDIEIRLLIEDWQP